MGCTENEYADMLIGRIPSSSIPSERSWLGQFKRCWRLGKGYAEIWEWDGMKDWLFVYERSRCMCTTCYVKSSTVKTVLKQSPHYIRPLASA